MGSLPNHAFKVPNRPHRMIAAKHDRTRAATGEPPINTRWVRTAPVIVQTSSAAPPGVRRGIEEQDRRRDFDAAGGVAEPLADTDLVERLHHHRLAGQFAESSHEEGGRGQDLQCPRARFLALDER